MCPIGEKPQQYHQAGMVSWGIGCGGKTPGVYVNVAKFRNWIDDQMAQNNLDTSYYDSSKTTQMQRISQTKRITQMQKKTQTPNLSKKV